VFFFGWQVPRRALGGASGALASHLVIPLICNPCLSTVFAVTAIMVVVFITVTTVSIMTAVLITAVTVVTTWTPSQSYCNDQHDNQ
jgi:hypothetical protein